MAEKPTYEELEQRVKELEKTVFKRKPPEEALIENVELYRLIVENVTDLIWIMDMEMKFTYFSPSVTQMRGYSVEEAMAQSVEEAMTPASFESAMEIIAEQLELHYKGERDPAKSRKMEAELTCKDGSTVWTEIESNFIYNSEGQPTAILGITRNIIERKESEKERKRAEEALRNSNEKLTALFQSSPFAIITLDSDGIVTFWNPAAKKIFGWGEKEVIGRFLPFVTEGKKSEHHALRNRVLSGEVFHDVEALRQKKDGSDIYISISTVPLKDSTGSISGIMSINVDITERKKAEEALRKSQQLVEEILRAAPVRVFWKDLNLVYLGCNALFANDAGFRDPKDIIGKDDYQMGWRDQAELYRGDDRQVIESGCEKLLIEEPQTTPEGNTITLLTSKIPLRSSNGETIGILGTYMDITVRKHVEEQRDRLISDLQKALSEVKTLQGFLPICSHCKNVRDDKGYWNQIESYIQKHSDTEFSHSICPECAKKFYPDLDIYDDNGEVSED
jgi:PAS domain S-box-containing protein